MPNPPNSPSPSPEPALTNFAFPFRGADKKPITDEHILHAWLADETSGNFAFAQSGMWHGGIHVSADGAGKHLDLAHGVRCIADGHVVAYLVHRDYLTSEIAGAEGEDAQSAQYSAAFTLVRHTLEYPASNRLTFFSLYMHLQSLESYRKQGMTMPPYWPKVHEVTEYASNRPLPDPHQGAAPPEQIGQNIRSQPNLGGTVLGILQRGARVQIGARSPDGKWGRISAIESGAVLPPQVATLPGQGAQTGWVYLAKEQGHWPLTEVMSEASCDQIVTPEPIPIKAGDLIGHLGEYWQPEAPTQSHQRVHIEVFCDDSLPAFLAASRSAASDITDFAKLPLLRIDRGVKLYSEPSIQGEGKDAPLTAVVQIYSQTALDALPEDHQRPADKLNWGGQGEPWWKITSANSLYNDITGWVRNRQTPAGRVTRESQHAWPDFDVFETPSGDGLPTLFDSTDAWLDHVLRADKPGIHDVCKLNPLTCELYRGLSPMRNESNAATELRTHGENRWTRFRASRLVPKHRSEWASQTQYEDFFGTVLKRVEQEPYHDAELARIKRLTWWDAVANNVSQPFPASPNVFHIHPVALVGNFFSKGSCACTAEFTQPQLHAIATHASSNLVQVYTTALNKAFSDFDIKTCLQKIHFLSQILHESGEFQYTRELGGPKSYDPWRGRGLIQITLEENYKAYQDYVDLDFTSGDPARSKLESAPHALLSAAWFFSVKHNLHKHSELDDFIWITRVINGGFNGYNDRLKYLNRAAEVLGIQPCFKLNKTGTYRLKDSRAFSEKRASFAWGLWSDPASTRSGKAKSREEAIIGYNRYLELDIQANNPVDAQGLPKDKGWYGIGNNVRVKHYAQARIQQLTSQT